VSTYRVRADLDLEISTKEEWTKEQLSTAVIDVLKGGLNGPPVAIGAAISLHEDPYISIQDPECDAIARPNSVDGQLYACGATRANPVHRPVEECDSQPCEKPVEHHAYSSPGWDRPAASVVS
jgi:hypothetical protein